MSFVYELHFVFRAEKFADRIVQALTSGQQHFERGLYLDDTDISVETTEHMKEKVLGIGSNKLLDNSAFSYGCACELREYLCQVKPHFLTDLNFFTST